MISLLREFDSELAGVAVFADNAQEEREKQFDYKSLLKVTNIDVKNQSIDVEDWKYLWRRQIRDRTKGWNDCPSLSLQQNRRKLMKTPFINKEDLETIVAEFRLPFTCMMRREFVRKKSSQPGLFLE